MRHVRDLAGAQAKMGHEIGIIAGQSAAEAGGASLEELACHCRLGVHRLPMKHRPHPSDIEAAWNIRRLCKIMDPTILHGHGAKGGAYARIVGRSLNIRSCYTPHGGSLYYGWSTAAGGMYMTLEKALRSVTDRLLFVCQWERQVYDENIGLGGALHRVVLNGLWERDFETITMRDAAADIVSICELRSIKGIDVLLKAIAAARPRRLKAVIAGDGAERSALEVLRDKLGLRDAVRFLGVQPAREVFAMGRVAVFPSRREALPYGVLEATAAVMPVIATGVGGVPEILPADKLVPADNVDALAAKMQSALSSIDQWKTDAAAIAAKVRMRFEANRMANDITEFYSASIN
jgi:glycosyltransferase involved in cell wall biosynthesis